MFAKFGEAIQLLCSNVALFGAIIFTIRLPGNVVVNHLVYNTNVDELVLIRASIFIEGVFGPIYIGALIVALATILEDGRPTYSQSIGAGFRNWGHLFAARLAAGFIIAFGLIAFIVPGIVLMVRYALMDPAVVLEGADSATARARSSELTVGVRWQIFASALLFFVFFIPFTMAIYLPVELLPEFDNMLTAVVLDCVNDIVFAVIQIVMFLYYWQESRVEESEENVPEQEVALL